MADNILTIEKYFQKGTFVIPNYQRGFKWGVPNKEDGKCAVGILMDNIKSAFERGDREYFIEAVTVVEEGNTIILVDGQQRTTTLYLIFVALGEFDFLKSVQFEYNIRKDSDKFLKEIKKHNDNTLITEDTQDIFFFNKALETIKVCLTKELLTNKRTIKDINNKSIEVSFNEYIKKNVCLLYNKISSDKAINNFVALNGLKAIMKDEELIKSDLLIKSSRIESNDNSNIDDETKVGLEWKISEDRGRLARNWDKWLYWWNQEEVKKYYKTEKKHPLHYLLVTYWNINKTDSNVNFSFECFKSKFISNPVDAKKTFEGLRKLQKTFEDFYTNTHIYNSLGIILKIRSNKEEALQYLLNKSFLNHEEFADYAKWTIVGATHLEIIDITKEKKDIDPNSEILIKHSKAQNAIDLISNQYVYWNENGEEFKDDRKEYAFRFLLLLNIIEDNKLNRKFNFSIWDKRSLEHIYPKSKSESISFENNEGSIHCIGNLVLLYGVNNSSFGCSTFQEKKDLFFKTKDSVAFESRNLLHTLSVFSSSKWGVEDINKNKINTINSLKNYYGI